MSANLMPRFNTALIKGSQVVDFARAGLGTSLNLAPSGPPQGGAQPYLSYPVAVAAGADCPTCNLVEIPYNPSLPVLR